MRLAVLTDMPQERHFGSILSFSILLFPSRTPCPPCPKKKTFHPNIDVKSIYLRDTRRELPDQVKEGEQGWVMQGVLSRASFRRPPVSGQETFTVVSLRISNIYAKKRGIAKKLILTIRAIMIGQHIDYTSLEERPASFHHGQQKVHK